MADDVLRHVKDGHSLAHAIVDTDTVREALIVLYRDLRVVAASRSFYQTFRANPQYTQGQLFYDLDNGQWNIPALRLFLEEVIPQHRAIEGYEVEHQFPTELVINALKHAFPPGHEGEIVVRYDVDGAGWRLSVSDNGIGRRHDGHERAGGGPAHEHR